MLAIFKDEAAADTAAETVKESGLARHDAIGVLVLNEKGEVNTEKVGKRSVGKGAGIGLAWPCSRRSASAWESSPAED